MADLRLKLGSDWVLSGDTSISGVYAKFDLKRNERNYNSSLQRNAYSNIKVSSNGIVPMVDASLDISKNWNDNLVFGAGYTVSSCWVVCARLVLTVGMMLMMRRSLIASKKTTSSVSASIFVWDTSFNNHQEGCFL